MNKKKLIAGMTVTLILLIFLITVAINFAPQTIVVPTIVVPTIVVPTIVVPTIVVPTSKYSNPLHKVVLHSVDFDIVCIHFPDIPCTR